MQNNQKIPEGWSVKKLSDLCSKISDGIHTTPKYVDKSEYHFINGNNLRDGHIYIYEDTKCVSFEEYTKQKQELGTRTLLMSINGTIGSLANYCNEDVVLGKSAAFMNFNDMQTKKYVYTILQTNSTKRYFENELTGSTIKNLSLKSIKNMKLLLPPLPEQEKIAGILGTWDEAIEKLSSLIEQKKLLKKGLMQRLLTGKTRLNGFTQPWKEVKLGELIKQKRIVIEKGKSLTSENIVEGAIPVIAGGKTSPYSHNKFTHNKPCITISASGAYAGYVWKHITPIWASDCNVLYSTDYDTNFLGCCLEYKQQQIYQLQTGGAQPHVYATDIKIITVPNINVTEQQAIADVLSTADEEINLLNKKLEALKEQKKGLMQQLLTGQTRVKVN